MCSGRRSEGKLGEARAGGRHFLVRAVEVRVALVGLPASALAAKGTPNNRVDPRPRHRRRNSPQAGAVKPATRDSTITTRHSAVAHSPLHRLALREWIPAARGAGRESGASGSVPRGWLSLGLVVVMARVFRAIARYAHMPTLSVGMPLSNGSV